MESGADKPTLGSQVVGRHSLRSEKRLLYIRGKQTGGIHDPAPAPPTIVGWTIKTPLLEMYAKSTMM